MSGVPVQAVVDGGLARAMDNVEKVSGMRKTVMGVGAMGAVREGSTGRVVLPVVRACAGVVVAVPANDKRRERGERRGTQRNCRGLRLVKGGRIGAGQIGEVMASADGDVRPFAVATLATEAQVRPRPELAFYRKYTEAMLRRYVRMSTAAGRVPSLLGRELFHGKVTNYRVTGFDDAVIFCLDMEKCLAKLQEEEKVLVKRIGMQEYSQGEAAGLMGMSLRGVILKYGQALDRLTGVLLAAGMMEPLRKLAEGYEASA